MGRAHAAVADGSSLSSTALIAELDAALGALGERVCIVARGSRLVLWCSAACRDVHPAIHPGRSTGDIAGFDGLLDAIEADESSGPLPLREGAPVVKSPMAGNEDELPDSPFHVALVCADDVRLTLRFHRDVRPDDYLQRYVADREKLFMVSRSVSVSEMATTLAHELNQPIGAISNLLQGLQILLAREYDGELPEPLERALSRAGDQARFAAGIIARVRNFTEARAPRLAACDAGRLLGGTIELLDWVFHSEAVRVHLETDETPLYVSGDEILLQQVFANLLRNAVDAMRERPRDARRIHARVARDVDGIAIEIRDEGVGLAGTGETPFEPFRSAKRDGMGIGLNICRSFIEMHRGKLWLTSGERGGCVAHVLLPEHRP